MVDVLNKDQGLVQAKLSKKLQHVESAQRHIQGPSVTLTDGPLYISQKKTHQWLFRIGQTNVDVSVKTPYV